MFEAGPNFTVLNLHVPCDLSAGRLPSVNLCCLPATEGNWSEWPAPNHHDQTQHDSGQAFSYHLTGLGVTTPWTLGVSYRRIRHHETSGVNYFKLAKAAIYLGMKGLHQLGTNYSLPGDFLTIYTCDIDGSVDTVKGWHKFHMLDIDTLEKVCPHTPRWPRMAQECSQLKSLLSFSWSGLTLYKS